VSVEITHDGTHGSRCRTHLGCQPGPTARGWTQPCPAAWVSVSSEAQNKMETTYKHVEKCHPKGEKLQMIWYVTWRFPGESRLPRNDTVYRSSLPGADRSKATQGGLVTYQGATELPATALSLHTFRGCVIIIQNIALLHCLSVMTFHKHHQTKLPNPAGRQE